MVMLSQGQGVDGAPAPGIRIGRNFGPGKPKAGPGNQKRDLEKGVLWRAIARV